MERGFAPLKHPAGLTSLKRREGIGFRKGSLLLFDFPYSKGVIREIERGVSPFNFIFPFPLIRGRGFTPCNRITWGKGDRVD